MHQGISEPPYGSLHSLILRTNMIRFDGCERLCNSLKYDINRVLVYMDLSECSIGVKGAKAVGDMLKKNESLLEIRLKYNQIGHEGTVSKGFRSAISPRRATVPIPRFPASPEHTAHHLTKTTPLHQAHLAEGLAHNYTLENLSLKGNAILDIGCEHLGAVHFGSLIDLDLRENYIGSVKDQRRQPHTARQLQLHPSLPAPLPSPPHSHPPTQKSWVRSTGEGFQG